MNRRTFLKNSAMLSAALAAPAALSSLARGTESETPPTPPATDAPKVTDTNIHLFQWPFRHLKYGKTDALVAKLQRHNVGQAWAGSYEALLFKDMAGVNERLAEECAARGGGLLIPVGGINPLLPGWDEHMRRCQEVHGMRVIRLHPAYQGYTLGEPVFARMLEAAADRRLIVQIALLMEDIRVQLPLFPAPLVNPGPLVPLLTKLPHAQVQLLHGFAGMRLPRSRALFDLPNVTVDISGIEGTGALGALLAGNLPSDWFGGFVRGGPKLPVERLLFGSHAPYFPIENALLKCFESPLSRPQMQAIFAGNASRLLNLA
jgi:predicted TIM-barrel fold metal-dependent hydrolase